MKKLLRFLQDESGPTAVEYAVMLAMIIMVCVAAVNLVGQTTAASFTDSATQLEDSFGN